MEERGGRKKIAAAHVTATPSNDEGRGEREKKVMDG